MSYDVNGCRGLVESCRWLIANRANLKAEDSSGRTPLDIAKVGNVSYSLLCNVECVTRNGCRNMTMKSVLS